MRRLSIHVLLVSLFLFSSCYLVKKESGVPARLDKPNADWVETTLRSMSIDQKIGQLFMIRIGRTSYNFNDPEFIKLKTLINRYHIGGIIFRSGEVYERAAFFNRLQKIARVPLLISADIETGTGRQLKGAIELAPNMGIAASGKKSFAREAGRISATEARAAGVHMILAPVADVNNNPLNPIINTRSYGENPQQVAEYVSEFIAGVQENGALATAKHFPGHGNVRVDSHKALPVIDAPLSEFEKTELVPFEAAIKSGVAAIMTAHIAVPAMENGDVLPATMSTNILNGLLRNKMHYDGLIITDALGMRSIRDNYYEGYAAVQSLLAGADILLIPLNLPASFLAVRKAVQRHEISMARIDQSVRRILLAKSRLGITESAQTDPTWIETAVDLPANNTIAERMAAESVTLLRNRDFPLNSQSPLILSYGDTFPELKNILVTEFPSSEYIQIDLRTTAEEIDSLAKMIENASAVINCMAVRAADSAFTGPLADVLALSLRKPANVYNLLFGSPYWTQYYPAMKNILLLYRNNGIMQRAAGRALTGRTAISGHLPVNIPGVAHIGDGDQVAVFEGTIQSVSPNQLLAHPAYIDSLRDFLKQSIADSAFPGCAVAVGYNGYLVMKEAFGHFTYDPATKADAVNSIFDLASVTKVVATTTSAMILYNRGQLDLDWKVQDIVPEFAGPGKEKITIRHLLTHSSGLPGWKKFYLEMSGKEQIIAEICKTDLEYEPGTKMVYSDLGMIMMMQVIETLTRKSLDFFAAENIFLPLGMERTFYKPQPKYLADIVPTEFSEFHKRMVRGFVHDENTYAMGGVSGHAGLFSTVEDLAAFCQMMLNGGIYRHRRILKPGTISLFTSRQHLPEGSDRALGWDTRSAERSSSGHLMSMSAFGHTGFTGTSLWLDPENNVFVVLLTNRVHPTRENHKILKVRPRVHDLVMKAVLK